MFIQVGGEQFDGIESHGYSVLPRLPIEKDPMKKGQPEISG